MATYNLPDPVYLRIASCFGAPIVSEQDLGLTKDFIIDTLILPAILEYYKYFPVEEVYQNYVNGTFEVPFPRDTTIGVIEARFNSNTLGGAIPSLNPLINEQNIRTTVGGVSGKWGTQNNYGYEQVRIMQNMERQGAIEYARTARISVDENNRKVTGFTNIFSQLRITWADYSDEWSTISFRRQNEVIDLAKSYILQYLGELRNQVQAQLPTEMNGEGFLTRAQELKEQVTTLWADVTKVVVIRG